MLKLGEYNRLTIDRNTSVGFYLTDGEGNDVLLPKKYIRAGFKIGSEVDVFVYKDYEHRWIATTLRPYIQLHQFANLKVKAVSEQGAFLDWGLEKDLFVPFREQTIKMKEGHRHVVYLYIDEQTHRLVASAKLNRFFDTDTSSLQMNDQVEGILFETTPLGFNVAFSHRYKGLLYHADLRRDLRIGERVTAWVRQVREEGGVDLSLEPLGLQRLEDGAEKILEILQNSRSGFLKLTDQSSPDEIQRMVDMSKKTFKRSVGILYKLKKIALEEQGIRLIEI